MITTNDILELKARKKVYDIIIKFPGLHLKEIVRNLDISEGAIRYHLRHLVKQDIIIKRNEGGYVRYYKKNMVGLTEEKIIHMIRRKVTRNIIIYLLLQRYATQKELSEAVGKDPATIKFHIKKLKKANIVEKAIYSDGAIQTRYKKVKEIECRLKGREIFYQLVDPYLIYDILTSYKKKLLDNGATEEALDLLNIVTKIHPRTRRVKANGAFDEDDVELMNLIYPIFFRT